MEDSEVDIQFQELVKSMPEFTEVIITLGDIARASARLQEASMWLAEFVQVTLNEEVERDFPDDLLTVLAQILPLSFEVVETLGHILSCDRGNECEEESGSFEDD